MKGTSLQLESGGLKITSCSGTLGSKEAIGSKLRHCHTQIHFMCSYCKWVSETLSLKIHHPEPKESKNIALEMSGGFLSFSKKKTKQPTNMLNVLINRKVQYFVLCCLVTGGYKQILWFQILQNSWQLLRKVSRNSLKKTTKPNKQHFFVGSLPLQQACHKYGCGQSKSK